MPPFPWLEANKSCGEHVNKQERNTNSTAGTHDYVNLVKGSPIFSWIYSRTLMTCFGISVVAS